MGLLLLLLQMLQMLLAHIYATWCSSCHLHNTLQHVVLTALWPAPQVVDFLGREPGSSKLTGYEKVRPLVNQQVAMKNREQISEGLLTGERGTGQVS